MAGEDERGRARPPGKGTQIGPYTVVRELGRGAMGVVYLAEHGELGHRHALKVLNPALLEDRTALRRFELEMENLARVDGHPGIVRVHSAGRTAEGSPWFAMEFVEGHTLTQAVKAGLSRERALDVVLQVTRALAHAHGLGLLHRDVKPDNVLVGADGQARLTDFGLARVALTPERLTRTTELLGTPFYMAPEQANPQAGKVGPWTDVYAAGAVLYEVLCGRPPHDGATTVEVCTRLLNDPVVPPRQRDPSVHPAVDRVVVQALGRRPQDRYPNGAALAAALEAALREASAPPPAPRPRGLVVVLGALAALSAALAVGAVLTAVARREAELERASGVRREAAGLEGLLRRGRAHEALERLAALQETREAAPRTPELAAAWAEVDAMAERARGARDDGAFATRLRSAKEALALGRTTEAREALEPGDLERDFPEKAALLALTGDTEAAHAAGAGLPPPARARVAAWAGDREAARAALDAVTPPARGRALGRSLEALAPGVAPPVALAPVEEDDGAWGMSARAELTLALGLPGLAACDALPRRDGDREDDLEARLALATSRVRAGIAAGRPRAFAPRLVDALREEGLDPFERADALAVLLEAGAREEVSSTFEGGVAGEAARVAPGHPGVARALWRRQVVAGTAGPPPSPAGLLDRARDAARARGAWAGLRALEPSAPGDAEGGAGIAPGARSFIEAERARCARGQDGAGGLLAARAADLAWAADAGPSSRGARAALELLEHASRLRPESALVAVSVARAALVLHDADQALAAAERAQTLARGDPLALIVQARALRARVDGHRDDLDEPRGDDAGVGLRADLERASGRGDADLDRRAALALAPVVEAWERALAAATGATGAGRAPRDDPDGPPVEAPAPAGPPGPRGALEREARLGLAAASGERGRRLLRGGATLDEARPLLDAARAALLPLLGGLDPTAVADARADLGRALEAAVSGAAGGDGDLRAREDALAALARAAPPGAREALLLGASLRIDGDGQAWAHAHLALAGDLPARALLEAGAALGERDAASRRRRLERADALCPLPQVRLAALAQGGFERTPAGLDALAGVVLDAPEWAPLVVWLLGALDPGAAVTDVPALERDLDLAAPGADPVRRPVARALGRFSLPFGDPGRTGTFVPRVRARCADASRALAADPDAVGARALRAVGLLQLAQVLGRGGRDRSSGGDPGSAALAEATLDDARHDLAVVRAARPDAAGLDLLSTAAAGTKDGFGEAADGALARGFEAASVERLRGTLGAPGGESQTDDLLDAARVALERGPRAPVAHARHVLGGGHPALGLALLAVEAERALDPLALDARDGVELDALVAALGDEAIAPGEDDADADALTWAIASRRELARNLAQRRPGASVAPEVRAATLRDAAGAALRWSVRARRAGDSPALLPLRAAVGVPLRLPATPAVTRAAQEMLSMGQPQDGQRAAAWARLRAPEAALEALGRAVDALLADGRGQRPPVDGPMDPGDRALGRLVGAQDAAQQARAATEALALKRWGDLSLALDRALAFDPEGSPARAGARLVRAVRRLAPRDVPQNRARALRAAWRLADLAAAQAGAAPALRGERADALLDLVASGATADAREAARALEVARGDADASRPTGADAPEVAVAGWWRLVRAAALDGQPAKAREAALALKAALAAGGREAFVREVETDPALPRVRALPEVEQVLRDLGLATW